jgi:hypothetical protein
VRCHGKRIKLAREEKKKKERGESSTRLDGLGAHGPKHRRRVEQRLGTYAPGSPLLYF